MEYLTRDELRRLFQVAYERNRLHHLALVVTLWHGLRVSETVTLKGKQVADGSISIRRLKKSKPTCQPLHMDGDVLFDESPLMEMAKSNKGRLFNFGRKRVDQFIKRYGEMAGLHPSKCHMHALKHSCAMLIWDATKSLGSIQNYLGHKAPSSTLVYLAEVDAQKAFSAVASISI